MSLVNEYTFHTQEGTSLEDLIGSNNGTLGGATLPSWSKSLDLSKRRNYLSFVGGNGSTAGDRQRVEFTLSDFQYNGATDFSIVCSYKHSTSAQIMNIFGTRDTDAANYIWLAIVSNKIRIQVRGGSSIYYIKEATNAFVDGELYFICASYNATTKTCSLYINGVNDNGSVTVLGTITNQDFYSATSKALLGSQWTQSTTNYINDLTGSIAYFANYNHALSTDEIKRITEERLLKVYTRESGATYPYLPPKNSIRDGLYFSHPLMGGSNDISGNAYNATDTSVDYSTICSNGLPVATYNGSTSKSIHSTNLTLGNVFSFGCWFKTTTSQTNKWIMGCYTSSTNTGDNANYVTYALIQSANSATQKLSTFCVDSAAHTTISGSHPESSQVINDGKWYRCIVVVDAANGVKMYLDGEISTITAVNMSGNFNGRQPNIGCCSQLISNSQTNVNFWAGSIRDAFMVNRALSAIEVDRDFRDTYIS